MSRIVRPMTIGLFLALAACNTVSGMGQDIESGGAALTDTADDAQRQM